jgi:protein deglycase
MKTACVLLANGFEEVEAITPIDYLRRAGVEVISIAVEGKRATGSHGIVVEADAGPEALAKDYACVVVPGGQGVEALAASPRAIALIKRHFASGALVAAICAAPAVVLHRACGLLAGRRYTCFPGLESTVEGAIFSEDRVVVDGRLVTSRGAGTAGEFAEAIIAELVGRREAESIAQKVLLR